MAQIQGANNEGEVYSWPYVEHDTSQTSLDCSKDGRTRQEFAKDCDINVLLDKYEKVGMFPAAPEPVYMDVSQFDAGNLADSLRMLSIAEQAFMTLPAKVRREFDNDPVKFVEFAENPENLPQMREWQLARPLPPEPETVKVEVVNPAAAGDSKP